MSGQDRTAAQDRDKLLRNYVGQIPVAVGELLDENERLRAQRDKLLERGRESALPTEPKYGSSSFWQPAQGQEWVCPKCNVVAWQDYCQMCGTEKPSAANCPRCGLPKIRYTYVSRTTCVVAGPPLPRKVPTDG